MIKIYEGDLLISNADVIAHQVNCQGKMNSGVAKQIRNKYPYVYEEYTKIPKAKLGYNQYVPIVGSDTGTKYVCNMFAQDKYGYDGKQYTDIKALESCLQELHDTVKALNYKVALPYKIGCVRGGANWEEVYGLIDRIFHDYQIELWKYDKG